MMDGLLTCEDDWHLHVFGNMKHTYQSLGNLYNTTLDHFQYRNCRHYMWQQKLVQLDYEGGIASSWWNALHGGGCHIDNDTLDKNSGMPVWCQRSHFLR